jgi:uncharacterized membrane protein YadS
MNVRTTSPKIIKVSLLKFLNDGLLIFSYRATEYAYITKNENPRKKSSPKFINDFISRMFLFNSLSWRFLLNALLKFFFSLKIITVN